MNRPKYKELWRELQARIGDLFEQNIKVAKSKVSNEEKLLRLGSIYEDDFIMAMMKDMEQEAKGQKPTAIAEFLDSFKPEKEA